MARLIWAWGKLRIEGHGLLELLDAVREPVLLEKGDAEVVGAVRGLAARRRRRRCRLRSARQAQADGTRKSKKRNSKEPSGQDHPAIVSGPEARLKAARRDIRLSWAPPGCASDRASSAFCSAARPSYRPGRGMPRSLQTRFTKGATISACRGTALVIRLAGFQ